jgi:CDP-glucose 4,6-dehydratase
MDSIKNLKSFWKNKKVFITGHTGFKGSWLCIILKLLNSNIHGYALRPERNSLFNKSKIEKELSSNIYANIKDISKLKKKLNSIKPEIIFHLAAQPLVIDSYKKPLETFNVNINGTLNLLECIRNISSVKSIVIITTDKVYKINKKNISYKEIDELGGFDPYSASKVGAEIIVDSYIKSFFKNSLLKNRVATARAGNVIGGGDYSNNRLVPDIINSINKRTKLIVRNPNHIRPWQHVLDPLMGYLILAEKQYKNRINSKNHSWNFGPNKNSFKKVIDIIKYIKKLKKFEYSLKKNNKFKETNILKLNSSKAKEKLKWNSKWSLNQSLKETIEWNTLVNKGLPERSVCEKQFLMHVNPKKYKYKQ